MTVQTQQVFGNVSAAAFLKLGQAQVAVVIVDQAATHRLYLDNLASEFHLKGISCSAPRNRQSDLLANCPTQQPDSLHHVEITGGFAINRNNLITGQNAGTTGWRAFNGGDNDQLAVPDRQLNADTTKFTMDLNLEVVIHVSIQVAAVRIEIVENAAHSTTDQFIETDFFNIVVANQGQHISQQLNILVILLAVQCRRGQPHRGVHQQNKKQTWQPCAQRHQLTPIHRRFNQFNGLIGAPL